MAGPVLLDILVGAFLRPIYRFGIRSNWVAISVTSTQQKFYGLFFPFNIALAALLVIVFRLIIVVFFPPPPGAEKPESRLLR